MTGNLKTDKNEKNRSKNIGIKSFDWNRSISEPDLTDAALHTDRLSIHHIHEHVSVDDLKYYRRRKKPPDSHTRSTICLYNEDEPVLPFGCLKSEYTKRFSIPARTPRPCLLRRATSLHLEGSMNAQTEQQSQYLPYSHEDIQYCRAYPIKNPDSILFGSEMTDGYNSSFISYPMIDRSLSILPREAFKITDSHNNEISIPIDNRFKPEVDHRRKKPSYEAESTLAPSEYSRQYKPYLIEKAHSIPQLSHIKIDGEFIGIPEYRDKYKFYDCDCYSKSAPIKKADNLTVSGEVAASNEIPEYREKFKIPMNITVEKSLKKPDHLNPRGEFTKEVPEYLESFRDPLVKEKPERGTCREPYLRLRGKLEFNPEYRCNFVDFPRSRPVTKKATSSIRIHNATSPRRKFKSTSPSRYAEVDPTLPLIHQPEYRRAQYNYQIRERTPPKRLIDTLAPPHLKTQSKAKGRENLCSHLNLNIKKTPKRQPSKAAQTMATSEYKAKQESFENVGSSSKKLTKFGRRAKVSINEGNGRYSTKRPIDVLAPCRNDNKEAFVILKEPCRNNVWMKKSWYES